jgi:hypothetical protein
VAKPLGESLLREIASKQVARCEKVEARQFLLGERVGYKSSRSGLIARLSAHLPNHVPYLTFFESYVNTTLLLFLLSLSEKSLTFIVEVPENDLISFYR